MRDKPTPTELATIAVTLHNQGLHIEKAYYKGMEITDRIVRRWHSDKRGVDISIENLMSMLTLTPESIIGPHNLFKNRDWPERWEIDKEAYSEYKPHMAANFAAYWNKRVDKGL